MRPLRMIQGRRLGERDRSTASVGEVLRSPSGREQGLPALGDETLSTEGRESRKDVSKAGRLGRLDELWDGPRSFHFGPRGDQ